MHPHHAIDYDDATDALLRELAQDPAVRAVGETGLDYNRNYSPREVQLQVFERQLQIAVDLQMPLFLHQRDAHDGFHRPARRYRDKVPAAVVHCFTDTGEALRDYLALDCHIGITGWICDERRGTHLRELVREIPAQPADDRNRRAVSAAAHGAAAAGAPAQRADVSEAHLRGDRPRSRRKHGGHRGQQHGNG